MSEPNLDSEVSLSDQIPLDQGQRCFQMAFLTVIVAIYISMAMVWWRKNRTESRFNKVLVLSYFIGRALGHFFTFVCTLAASLDPDPENGILLNQICSNVFFLFAKTIPNYCIIVRLFVSLGVFMCPLKVHILMKVVPSLMGCLLLCQLTAAMFMMFEDNWVEHIKWMDYALGLFTFAITIVQCVILVRKIQQKGSLVFNSDRIHHVKVLYEAICFDVATLVILLNNVIQDGFNATGFALRWSYWIIQAGYLLVYTVIFCQTMFLPAFLIPEREPEPIVYYDDQ